MRNWLPVIVLLLASAVLLIPYTGTNSILGQGDEVMHIATVRESIRAGSYLIPVLDGAPNFYKPPLLFWLGIASELALGTGLLSIRLPSVLFAIATVYLLYLTLRLFRLKRRYAAVAGVFYLATLGTLKFGRLLMMEQGMAFAMMGVVLFFLRYVRYGLDRDIVIAGVFSALGFFFKGPLFQIYSGMLLMVWATLIVVRVGPQKEWRGRKKILGIVRAVALFHIPLIIPAVWIGYLLTLQTEGHTDTGFGMVWYFFFAENAAKFAQENQSEGRILLGWLTLAAPWSLLLIALVVYSFRARLTGPARFAGRILILFALVLSLFHLLPDRKDPYYIIPALPVLITGVLLFWKDQILRHRGTVLAQLGFSAMVSLVFLIVGMGLGWKFGALSVLALLFAIQLVIVGTWRFWSSSRNRIISALLASGLLVVITFQYVLLPGISQPLVPPAYRAELPTRLCIISDEPWDALEYARILPGHKISHAAPGSPVNCAADGVGVIVHNGLDAYTIGEGYVQAGDWPALREDISVQSVLEGFGDPNAFHRSIILYRSLSRTAGEQQ